MERTCPSGQPEAPALSTLAPVGLLGTVVTTGNTNVGMTIPP